MSYPTTKMAPNHHHAHHFMLHGLPLEPVSRTYQYRKIMKPMLERKRRARINKCLDELKDLMTSTLQADGENLSKLEKADILELTVRHLHRLRETNGLFVRHTETLNMEKFWSGFQHCAVEVSHFLQKYDQQKKHANGDLIKYIANYIPNMRAAVATAAAAAATANGAMSTTTTPPTAHIPLQQSLLSMHTQSGGGGVGGCALANVVNSNRNEHYQRFAMTAPRDMPTHQLEGGSGVATTKIAHITTSASPKPTVATRAEATAAAAAAAVANVRQQNLQQISASAVAVSNFERFWEAATRAAATAGATAGVHPYGRKALSGSNIYNSATDEIVDVSGGDDDESSCGYDGGSDGGGAKNCEYPTEDGGSVWRPW